MVYGHGAYVHPNVTSCMYKKYVNKKLPNKPTCLEPNPYSTDYRSSEHAVYYQSFMGISTLMIELGRIDIFTDAYVLFFWLCQPQQGQLETALNTISYITLHHDSRLY